MKKVQFILVLELRSGRKINFILSTKECQFPTRTSDWRRIMNMVKNKAIDRQLYKDFKSWGDDASISRVLSAKFVEVSNSRRHVHGVIA